jgi:hypothetical protein
MTLIQKSFIFVQRSGIMSALSTACFCGRSLAWVAVPNTAEELNICRVLCCQVKVSGTV